MKKTLPNFIITLAIFGFLGCQNNSSQARFKQVLSQAKEGNAVQTDHDQNWQEGDRVYFTLNEQKMVPALGTPPKDFYIDGIIKQGRFYPQSQVLGQGELATLGRYGWLEITSREFFPMESMKMVKTPFVKGYMTDIGFVPSAREVFDSP